MMLLARRYRTLEFEELEPFPCDGLIMYAVRIAGAVQLQSLPFWLYRKLRRSQAEEYADRLNREVFISGTSACVQMAKSMRY